MSTLKIGIVAGEHSGDLLGADLMSALSDLANQQNITIEYRGVAGPKMMALGATSYFDMEELSVMGVVEILKRLPRLLKKRKQLIADLIEWQPDVVIGIDAPEFNLGLELKLKEQGIKTVHYVSPSVWAWRQSRVKTIKKAVDKVLALLPFEKAFYDKHDVPCDFVGHTLADQIPVEIQKNKCREELELRPEEKVLAVLPGSRGSEIKFLLEPFLEAAQELKLTFPSLVILLPTVNEYRAKQVQDIIDEHFSSLNIKVSVANARVVMGAADVVLLASGTATLETMLMKTPMVTAYKVSWFSYEIFKRLIKTPFFTLPNLLAGKEIVPELIQDDASVANLVSHVRPMLEHTNTQMIDQFTKLHVEIKRDASARAANSIWQLLEINHK
ncbi:lipid-A-disaccharide synthase [Psychrosphaera sp.]|nr:lipid-A-disaccharide synthase [Psychrosphaera sp.]